MNSEKAEKLTAWKVTSSENLLIFVSFNTLVKVAVDGVYFIDLVGISLLKFCAVLFKNIFITQIFAVSIS